MNIDAQLLVLLKGTDLVASTSYLTLVGKMGYGEKLLGLKRFDYFRFAVVAAGEGPAATVERLRKVLDRQSTFYNRNKHVYSLDCRWDGDFIQHGQKPEDIKKRWTADLRNSLADKIDKDFVGQPPRKPVIFNKVLGYLVEVLVEDENRSARESIAAKLQGDLGGIGVSCVNRATLWWLALGVGKEAEARAMAGEIATTQRRDRGLLMNPNYQRAEVTSTWEIERV